MPLAQINIARMKAPLEDPIMTDFVNNLDRINARAEESPGFIWRLKDENNNATAINPFGDDFILVNLSVWKDRESLFQYVYHTDHSEILKRRKEWFALMEEMHMALWYVPEGQYPSAEAGKLRLEYLREKGESPYAFSFRKNYSLADLEAFLAAD